MIKVTLDYYDIEEAILEYVTKKLNSKGLKRDCYTEMFFTQDVKKGELMNVDYVRDFSKKPKKNKWKHGGKSGTTDIYPDKPNDLELEFYYDI